MLTPPAHIQEMEEEHKAEVDPGKTPGFSVSELAHQNGQIAANFTEIPNLQPQTSQSSKTVANGRVLKALMDGKQDAHFSVTLVHANAHPQPILRPTIEILFDLMAGSGAIYQIS